jgi:hypothetical protein
LAEVVALPYRIWWLDSSTKFRTDSKTAVTMALSGWTKLTTRFSPNLVKCTKVRGAAKPSRDLSPHAMAGYAMLFLAFYPRQKGNDCIVGEAAWRARV